MMNRLFILIIASALFCSCSSDSAEAEATTGSIVGSVTDPSTGGLVATAQVALSPGGKSTVTGSDGTFSFVELRPGDYTINVHKESYNPSSGTVTVVAGQTSEAHLFTERIPATVIIDKTLLDFGANSSQNILSFNIVNSNYEDLEWIIETRCDWITEIKPYEGILKHGQTQSIVVAIDREKLELGDNEAVIVVRSSNGSSNIQIKAYGSILSRIATEVATVGVSDVDLNKGTAIFNGNIKNVGNPVYSEKGFCVNEAGEPTIKDTKYVVSGFSEGQYSYNCAGLQEKTTYYVRAYAIQEDTVYYGTAIYFRTEKENTTAEVVTYPVTEQTSSSVILNGAVKNIGYPEYIEKGFCYNTSGMPSIYNNKIQVDGIDAGNFSVEVSNLNHSTSYYVRTYIIQGEKTIYGNIETFQLMMDKASVTFGDVHDVAFNTATFNGTVINIGDPNYTKRGFCYSKLADPKIEYGDLYVEENSCSSGSYSLSVDNLEENSTYYVRAYTVQSGIVCYSDNYKQFQTNKKPTIMTYSELTNLTCVIDNSGIITWDGRFIGGILKTDSYKTLGFVYDVYPNPTIGNGSAKNISFSGTEALGNTIGFYSDVNGLSNGVTYYVRAYAQTLYGYVYADQITIRLNPIEPVLRTIKPQNIQAVYTNGEIAYWTAQLQGLIYSDGNPHITDWGFVYGTNPNPVIGDKSSIVVSRQQNVNAGDYIGFYTNVTGLIDSQIYYVQAYAKTALGYTYAGVQMFETN